jgi:hypothetical protein
MNPTNPANISTESTIVSYLLCCVLADTPVPHEAILDLCVPDAELHACDGKSHHEQFDIFNVDTIRKAL